MAFCLGGSGGAAGSGKGECQTLVKTGQSATPVTEALPHRGAPPGGGGRARGSSQRHESAYSFRPRTSPRDPQKWLFLVNPGCGQEAGLVTHFPIPPGRKQNRPSPKAFAKETQATVRRPGRSKSPLLNLQGRELEAGAETTQECARLPLNRHHFRLEMALTFHLKTNVEIP